MLPRFVCILILTLAAALSVAAQDEKLKEIKGTIRQFDLKAGQITIKSLYSENVLALNLAAKDVPVTNTLGEKLKLTDVREELRITAKIRGEDDVVALRIDGPYQHGFIKSIDVAARTVVFKDVFGEKKIKIPEAAKVMIGGNPGSLADCKPGGAIQFLTSLDKKTILEVYAGKGVNGRDPFLRIIRYFGVLADIDQPKRHVQILVQNTDAGMVKSYDVSPDAYLRLLYHLKPIDEVGFDQFAKWVKIYYYVDRDTGRIVNMDAELPVMVRRRVVKLDGRKITVEDEQKEKTFELAANVKVLTPNGDGKIADIAAGRMINCALSLDRSQVAVVYLWDK